VTHDETGICGERILHQAHRIDVILQVVLDGTVERCGSRRIVGGEFQAAGVANHRSNSLCVAVRRWRIVMAPATLPPL
jgi:hypothetical protein